MGNDVIDPEGKFMRVSVYLAASLAWLIILLVVVSMAVGLIMVISNIWGAI